MSNLPTLAKTWQFAHVNNALSGNVITDSNDFFLLVKNAALAFGSNPLTVVGSSNGVSANMTGTDLLTGQPAMVRASTGTPHSWIVLALSQIAAGAQVCFDFNDPSLDGYVVMDIVVSPTGFSGGSTTNRPTAVDEQIVLTSGSFTGMLSGTLGTPSIIGGQARGHVMLSSDGECFRVLVANNGVVGCFLLIDKAGNSVPGWTDPMISRCFSTGPADNTTDVLDLSIPGIDNFLSVGPGGAMPLIPTYSLPDFNDGNTLIRGPNEISGEYNIYPIGLVSVDENGRNGHVQDLFVILRANGFPFNGCVVHDLVPVTSRQFIVFSNYAFPWDGIAWWTA